MLSLTRKADYALVALVYLAHRQRHGAGPASARMVAETFDLPQPVLMNTLKTLARHGLVQSHRGVGGGYELGRDPTTVSLLEVVRSIEAEHAAEDEANPETAPRDPEQTRSGVGGEAVRRLQHRLDGFLERLSLADLLEEPGPASPDASKHTPLPGRFDPAARAGGFVPLRLGERSP